MLLAGDELGRTQEGNNNAYCQDNELSWVDWDLAGSQAGRCWTSRVMLAVLRREHPVFRRRRFFRGRPGRRGRPGGHRLAHPVRPGDDRPRTGAPRYARAMMVFLNGDAITEPDPRGEPVRDDSFLLLFSAHHEPLTFTLPAARFGRRWAVTLDSAAGRVGEAGGAEHRAGGQIVLASHSMMALRRTGVSGARPARRPAAPG